MFLKHFKNIWYTGPKCCTVHVNGLNTQTQVNKTHKLNSSILKTRIQQNMKVQIGGELGGGVSPCLIYRSEVIFCSILNIVCFFFKFLFRWFESHLQTRFPFFQFFAILCRGHSPKWQNSHSSCPSLERAESAARKQDVSKGPVHFCEAKQTQHLVSFGNH